MSNQLIASLGPMYARDVGTGVGLQIRGALVFPATVNVADPVGLTDVTSAMLSVDAAGRLRCLVTSAAGAVFTTQPLLTDSSGVTGRAVTPGVGGVIATITLAAGTYDIQVFASFDVGAPVAATETNNMEFREGAGVISVLQVLPVINVYSPARLFRRVVDGVTAISVNATAAGTAGVGYNAEITAIRIA
jgi:hypothetical protein